MAQGGGEMLSRIWDVTFTVSDLDRAVDFYQNVLGLSKKYHFRTYAGFDCGGVEIGLTVGDPAEGGAAAPLVDFLVQDLDAAYRALRGREVLFVKPPHTTAWGGRVALFADPDGNVMQLVQIDWRRYFCACAS
jgi:catechol 2,3-dioxygenase-like lactoylglutathione lyase family enzyme